MATATLALAPLYFAIGALTAWAGYWQWSTYLAGAGIVGSLASVLGVLSLRQPLSLASELHRLEIDRITNLQRASNELARLEGQSAEAREAIDALQLQHQRMEVAIKKASLAVFLEERHRFNEDRLLKQVEQTPGLREGIDEAKRIGAELAALNREIEDHEDVELLKEIIDRARPARRVALNPFPPNSVLGVYFTLAEEIGKKFSNLFVRQKNL